MNHRLRQGNRLAMLTGLSNNHALRELPGKHERMNVHAGSKSLKKVGVSGCGDTVLCCAGLRMLILIYVTNKKP
jgi:hypothetical protein